MNKYKIVAVWVAVIRQQLVYRKLERRILQTNKNVSARDRSSVGRFQIQSNVTNIRTISAIAYSIIKSGYTVEISKWNERDCVAIYRNLTIFGTQHLSNCKWITINIDVIGQQIGYSNHLSDILKSFKLIISGYRRIVYADNINAHAALICPVKKIIKCISEGRRTGISRFGSVYKLRFQIARKADWQYGCCRNSLRV